MFFSRDKGFYLELFKLALPIALQSLVTSSFALVDNLMISTLGNSLSSAAYLGNQIAFFLTMLVAGVESTVLVLSSQFMGANKNDKARSASCIGISAGLILAILFFVLSTFSPRLVLSLLTDKDELISDAVPFLRALGVSFLFFAPSQAIGSALRSVKKPKVTFAASFIALFVNIYLNFALIFGKFGFSKLGILGAGVATFVARVFEFSVLFIYAFLIDRDLKLRIRSFFKFDKNVFFDFSKTAYPIILAQLAWSINTLFSSSLMGHIKGEGVVAGLSVAIALYNLSYVVTNGMSGAVAVLNGRMLGSENVPFEKMREYSRSVQVIFVILGVLSTVLIQALKLPFISLWGISGPACDFAKGFIDILSFLVVGTAYQSASLNGLVKSSGDVKFILKTESFFVFCLIIPVSLLAFSLGASPFIVFTLLKCDQILKCPVAFFKLRRLNNKKRADD